MTLLGKLNHSGQRPVPQRAIGHQVRHTSLTYFSFVLLRKLLLFSPPYSEQSYTERGITSQGIWEMKKWKWMGSMSVKLRRGNRWRYQILGNFSLKRKKAQWVMNCSLSDKSIWCCEFMFHVTFISHFISLKMENAATVSMGIFKK